MNAQGRHCRLQEDLANPSCDYESKGQKCSFFATEKDLAALPYPTDVSLGPGVVDTQPISGNNDLSEIISMLQQQKAAHDLQFSTLQQQITALATPGVAQPVTVEIPTPAPPVHTPAPPVQSARAPAPTAALAPGASPALSPSPSADLINAAAALTSHLRTGIGHSHNLGFKT